MTITLGSVLQRLEAESDDDETFAFLMPTASGPCRFGVYNVMHKIAFERAGWKDRVRIVSPSDDDYFAGLPPDFQLRVWTGMVAADVLLAALHDVRPDERAPGQARRAWELATADLHAVLERPSAGGGGIGRALLEVGGGLFGVRDVVRRAAAAFAAALGPREDRPVIGLVGEIYVRLDPFANDYVVERLEEAGARVRLAPFGEWIEYTTWTAKKRVRDRRPVAGDDPVAIHVTAALQDQVADALWGEMGRALGWGRRAPVEAAVRAGGAYVSEDLLGEAILSVGGPLHEYLAGEIDGVVAVGPLECMPNKIAESHLMRADADHGLPSLALSVNGDPVDPRVLEDFVFEVREAAGRRPRTAAPRATVAELGWRASRRVLGMALSGASRLAGPLLSRPAGGPVAAPPAGLTPAPGGGTAEGATAAPGGDSACEARTVASRSSIAR